MAALDIVIKTVQTQLANRTVSDRKKTQEKKIKEVLKRFI